MFEPKNILWVLICATLMAHIKNKKNKDPTSIFGLKKLEIFKFLRLFFLFFMFVIKLVYLETQRNFLISKVVMKSLFFTFVINVGHLETQIIFFEFESRRGIRTLFIVLRVPSTWRTWKPKDFFCLVQK